VTGSPRAAARAVAAAVLVASVAASAVVPAASAAAGAARSPDQLIMVTAPSHRATYARLIAYRRADGRWVPVFGPWTARVGYNGIAKPRQKREGDGRTPSGTYRFGFFFGVLPDPDVAFSYRRAYRYDFWDDDPSSRYYNEWVSARRRDPGVHPEPMDQRPAYDYAAVIRYNPTRIPGLGSAIFLHVGTGTPTAGCVSLPQRELLRVLRWLRPGRSPLIEIRVR
jgi:L,D-peptidoglycan transpeptidase YkuD (ErfK/YbiS/YcfS/YnhG family)